MSKLYPDCGYFNEEKDSEYAPITGQCEDCYRYEICSSTKKATETHMKLYTPKKDSILVIEVNSDEMTGYINSIIERMRKRIEHKFPELRFVIVPNINKLKITINNKQEVINTLKGIIKQLEEE